MLRPNEIPSHLTRFEYIEKTKREKTTQME